MTIQTTVVGSYPVPSWLHIAPSRGALRDAIAVVYKTQELAGIDVVSDGELYRFDVNHPETNGMIDYFVGQMSGVSTRLTREEIRRFHADKGNEYRAQPAAVVRDAIGEGSLNLPADFAFAKELSVARKKFTLTGPHMLSKVLLDTYYGDRAALAMAIAEVLRKQVEEIDADVVQLDEANISGHPDEWQWAAAAINHVLSGVKGEKGLHICFGNYGGQSVQKGMWQALIPFMNAVHVNHLVLEFARRGYAEIDVLCDVRPEIGIGVGVVDIKDNVIESPDTIASRLELAARRLGPERIRYAHPDCGFWMLPRSVADGKMHALVQGRNLYAGSAVAPSA